MTRPLNERAKEFEDEFSKGFRELVKLGADLSYVAYILAYTEDAKNKDAELMQKRKKADPKHVWDDWKKVSKIIESYREEFQKTLLKDFAGEALRRRLVRKREEKCCQNTHELEKLLRNHLSGISIGPYWTWDHTSRPSHRRVQGRWKREDSMA